MLHAHVLASVGEDLWIPRGGFTLRSFLRLWALSDFARRPCLLRFDSVPNLMATLGALSPMRRAEADPSSPPSERARATRERSRAEHDRSIRTHVLAVPGVALATTRHTHTRHAQRGFRVLICQRFALESEFVKMVLRRQARPEPLAKASP